MTGPRERVLLGFTGGAKSVAAAALLQAQGFEVLAACLRVDSGFESHCQLAVDVAHARHAAKRLGIELLEDEIGDEFRARVIEPLLHARVRFRASAPCLACHGEVRIPALARLADARGIYWVATGHLCSVQVDPISGQPRVTQGIDSALDQSALLGRVPAELLVRVMTPLGGLPPARLSSLLIELELPGGGTAWAGRPGEPFGCISARAAVFRSWDDLVSPSLRPRGALRTEAGELLGEHEGVVHYRFGKPVELESPGGGAQKRRVYAIAYDWSSAAVVAEEKLPVLGRELAIENLVWLRKPEGLVRFRAELRFEGPKDFPAGVLVFEGGTAWVDLDDPPGLAVGPGTWIPFYRDRELIGMGQLAPWARPRPANVKPTPAPGLI